MENDISTDRIFLEACIRLFPVTISEKDSQRNSSCRIESHALPPTSSISNLCHLIKVDAEVDGEGYVRAESYTKEVRVLHCGDKRALSGH